jgi:hypothetical protein
VGGASRTAKPGSIDGLMALAMPIYEWERGDRRKAKPTPWLFV